MAISRQEWADWLRSPVTEAVVSHLTERSSALIEQLCNIDADSVEGFGIRHLAYRNQINGLGEFLDLDSLRESIVTEGADED